MHSNKDPTQPKKEKKIESSKYSWEGELRVWEHPGGTPRRAGGRLGKGQGRQAGGRAGGTWEAGRGSASELDLLSMKPLVRPRQCFHLLHIS